MTLFSSLTNRIFFASAALAVLSIGSAIYFVNARVTAEAERELHRGLEEAGTLLDQHRATLLETYTLLARTIADLPKLKAAVATNDAPTVQPIAQDYHARLKSALFVVTDRSGHVLAAIGRLPEPPWTIAGWPAASRALTGEEVSGFWPHPQGVLQVVTVPISIGLSPPEMLGALSVGFLLDDELAAQFRALTDSEIAFAMDGRIRAATVPEAFHEILADLSWRPAATRVRLGSDDYVALARPFGVSDSRAAGGPTAIVLRSRTERLRFLSAIHTALAATAVLAVLLATILSYAVARTVTRPLAAITDAMREIAATGDLTRKIALHRSSKWDDEDARLLASTFDRLTDSVAAAQREAGQRERLSSLGRLSTVVAHEIRNPLMIIKAAVRTLRQQAASRQELQEAVADIDEEVTRLNRVVNDVLDFARPIQFEYVDTDVNRLCAESIGAASAEGTGATVRFEPDPAVGRIVTDPERLRVALVNILSNARQAVTARGVAGAPRSRAGESRAAAAVAIDAAPDVVVRTAAVNRRAVVILVRDRGTGIDPADAARVFDPYFTTRRGGTGLGLPIAKNIVEGLGGTIGVSSTPGEGSEIRVELPRESRPPDGKPPAVPDVSHAAQPP